MEYLVYGHETASDVFVKFIEGLKDTDLTKLMQVSMDKPSVNWKSYKKVEKSRNGVELSKLVIVAAYMGNLKQV